MIPRNCVIHVQRLCKRFAAYPDEKVALQDLSFSVGRGECVGFLGPNGAGKTTTIKVLLGLLPPSSGSFLVDSHGPGFVLDSSSLYLDLTVRENMAFYSGLIGVDSSDGFSWISKVGLVSRLDDRVRNLSTGTRKKAEIARALLGNPDLLFLDEPMSGLDPKAQGEMRDILVALQEQGTTIMITSHDLHNVHQLCDRFLFIKGGRIVLDANAEQLERSSDLERLYVTAVGI